MRHESTRLPLYASAATIIMLGMAGCSGPEGPAKVQPTAVYSYDPAEEAASEYGSRYDLKESRDAEKVLAEGAIGEAIRYSGQLLTYSGRHIPEWKNTGGTHYGMVYVGDTNFELDTFFGCKSDEVVGSRGATKAYFSLSLNERNPSALAVNPRDSVEKLRKELSSDKSVVNFKLCRDGMPSFDKNTANVAYKNILLRAAREMLLAK